MRPINFPEQTAVLSKPPNMTDEECISLPVYNKGAECISCWRPTWSERLCILFGGKVWLRILSGQTQPPVALETCTPFEQKGAMPDDT